MKQIFWAHVSTAARIHADGNLKMAQVIRNGTLGTFNLARCPRIHTLEKVSYATNLKMCAHTISIRSQAAPTSPGLRRRNSVSSETALGKK